MQQPYQPIDCDLYDELVALIMRRQHCAIRYWNDGEESAIADQLIDIYSQDKQEFLRLKSGITIRLDALISVDQLDFKN